MNNKSVMRRRKKIKIMLFVFMMLMVAAPQPLHTSAADIVASGNCDYDGNIKWKLDTDGVLTISGSGYVSDWDGHENEYYKKSVKSVVIENGIKKIENGMFEDCTSLTNVSIPESVTEIGSYYNSNGAFEGCTSLINITIPNSVSDIAAKTFKGCTSLTDISIPDGVTDIKGSTFEGCTSLTNVTIPDSVTRISDHAFFGCTSLKNITIPNAVTDIDSYAFSECASLTNISIPAAVTIVREGTFKNCSSLTDVTIPNSVTTIGSSSSYTPSDSNGAFEGCTSLKNITIPTSVTTIGDYTFKGCTSLAEISIPMCVTSLSNGMLSGCTSLANVTIPDSVTTIGDYTFKDCTSLTEITIPDSVTSIGDHPFEGCTSLTGIILPRGITSIQKGTFGGDTSVKNITIPNSVTSIDNYLFEGCTSLTNINIPDSVTKIDDYAFKGCTSLTNISIPDSVTKIGDYALEGCTSLTDINIPDSVTDIGEYAFKNCTSLVNVSGLKITSHYEFCGCTALENIVIPDGAAKVYLTAFTECTNLASIKIPESVQEIVLYNSTSVGNPTSTVLIVKKPSYAYDWVTNELLLFKIVDQTITVTFDSAGGDPIPALNDVAGNSEIELPKPQREGYKFLGWYDEDDNRIETCRVTESITLYAHWRQNAFTVTFDTNGGSSIPAIKNIAEDKSIKKPKDPTKKGYVFAGWFKGSKKYDFSSGIDKDITLKAKWTKNKAKIENCNSVDIGYTYKLMLSSNALIKKVNWTTSNKKILKVTKKKKNSVTVEGLKNKKKATLKAVVRFQDGTKQTVKQTIRVKVKLKKKVTYKNIPQGYPNEIMPFHKKVGAHYQGCRNKIYKYKVADDVYTVGYKVNKYLMYLDDNGYDLDTDYYKNVKTRVFEYSKGAMQVKITIQYLDKYGCDGYVSIKWTKQKRFTKKIPA